MRYTLLIALREFAENAKTKGFWIGIFMLPLIIGHQHRRLDQAGQVGAVALLRRGRPVRRLRRADRAVHRAAAPALGARGAGPVRSGKPARRTAATRSTCRRRTQAAVRAFIAAGGTDAYLERSRRRFGRTRRSSRSRAASSCASTLPKDIDADASSEAILARPQALSARRADASRSAAGTCRSSRRC